MHDLTAPTATPQLQPKKRGPHLPVRLQMKAGSYDIIPATADKHGPSGWRTMVNDLASIARWGHPATGIRMYGNDVFVFDLDIVLEAARDEILDAYSGRWPEFMKACLRRHSGGVKIALIGRCATVRKSRKTRRYFTGPNDSSKGQLLETFGRADKRLTVVQGEHSSGRQYGYIGSPIWERPVDTLPWFPDSDIDEAIEIADTIMSKHGLVTRAVTAEELSDAEDVYYLEPSMLFPLNDGELVALVELEKNLDAYRHQAIRNGGNGQVRGYASLWDPQSIPGVTSPDRVSVLMGSTGLVLHDFKTGKTYRWKHKAPMPDEVREKLKALLKNVALEWHRNSEPGHRNDEPGHRNGEPGEAQS